MEHGRDQNPSGTGPLESLRPRDHAPRMTEMALCFRTARLALRPVADADAAETAELMTFAVARQLSSWSFPMNPAQALEKIAAAIAQQKDRTGINFAVRERSGGELAGWIGLAVVADGRARLGYWLGTPFQGRGYMREAVPAALIAGSRFLGASVIEAAVQKDNEASIAILEGLGLVRVSERVEPLAWQARTALCSIYEWHVREPPCAGP
jgi:ribosomal-protein-alanine N-acetyltransferase